MLKNNLKFVAVVHLLGVMSLLAQDPLQVQFDFANTLLRSGNYFDAVTEFKRLLFFDSGSRYLYEANLQIGKAYKAGARLDDAIHYFHHSFLNARNEDQKFISQLEIVKCNILRRTTDRAFKLLDEMEFYNVSPQRKDSINYWRGWASLFADDWENAARYFSSFEPAHELAALSARTNKEKVSVTFARVISYILPGAGQIYTGNFIPGLLSIGWNLLAGYWTINSFAEERAFDGIISGSLVWLRFYRGAIQEAGKLAIEKNVNVSNKALLYLQKEYKGTKP